MVASEPDTLVQGAEAAAPEEQGLRPSDSPPARTSSLPSASSSSSTAALLTAVDALRLQEIERTRMFMRLAALLALVVGLSLFLTGGDPIAKGLLWACVGLVLVTTSWLSVLLRDEGGYTMRRALLAAYACVACAFAGIYFFGVFSPAAVVLPFGLYFFSAAQDFRATLSVFVACAVSYFTLGLLVVSGIVMDRGMITAGHLRPVEQVTALLLVEAILLATFLNSRATRALTIAAIERHDRAVRGLAQREALLKEARTDLERALRFEGLGRFSDTVLGSYRLGAVIGRGAVGEVYEARHVQTGAVAAVKLLHPSALANADLVRRFLREAKIAAAIDVPNVVRVLETAGLEAELPYIVMERLVGEDLAEHLRKHRALSFHKTVSLVRQVGRGLAAARAAGIVHRDLKPRNLFLAEAAPGSPIWKILDFGVSKLIGAEGAHTQEVVGTPDYMAPEQAAGEEVSHRTDLFALGAIAYRAVTGRPAFSGDHVAETLYRVTYGMPPRPSEVARVHADVDLVLAIAMAKAPSDRFDSGLDLAAALEAAGRGELDAALRARGAAIVVRHPWGKLTEGA